MKNVFVLGAAVLSLLVVGINGAKAEEKPECKTIESCRKLKDKVEARTAELLRGVTHEFTDIAKDKDGIALHMKHYDADKHCQALKMRLPTARELALYSQSLGAQGISETEKDGYNLVIGSDSAGNPDHFYFNRTGYKRPAGDLGDYWFWSSSVHPDYSNFADGLNGYNGGVDYYDRSYDDDYSAVRCVR
jgi:hypothetical protein